MRRLPVAPRRFAVAVGTAVALACASATGGCSFTMHALPADHSPKFEPHCDSGFGKPLLDFLGFAVFGGVGTQIVLEPDKVELENARFVLGIPGMVVGALFGVSTVVGLVRGGRCREAKRAHAAILANP